MNPTRCGAPVYQVEIRLAIDPAEERIGEFEHVAVFDLRMGDELANGSGDGIGRPHMTGADAGRKHEDAWIHGSEFLGRWSCRMGVGSTI